MRELSVHQILGDKASGTDNFVPAQFRPSSFLPWRTPTLAVSVLTAQDRKKNLRRLSSDRLASNVT